MHEHYAYWLEEKILQMTNYKDKGKEKKTISSFKSRNHFKAYYYQFITIGQAEGTSSPSTSMIDPWQRFRYSLFYRLPVGVNSVTVSMQRRRQEKFVSAGAVSDSFLLLIPHHRI
jgi:hypothetical protein